MEVMLRRHLCFHPPILNNSAIQNAFLLFIYFLRWWGEILPPTISQKGVEIVKGDFR